MFSEITLSVEMPFSLLYKLCLQRGKCIDHTCQVQEGMLGNLRSVKAIRR